MTPKPTHRAVLLTSAPKEHLDAQFRQLSQAGLDKFLVITRQPHRELEKLEKQFRSSKYSVEFASHDSVPSLLLARDFVKGSTFLATEIDKIYEASEYKTLLSVAEKRPAAAAIVAVNEVDDPSGGEAIYEIGSRITKIARQSPQGTAVTRWNTAGVYVLKPQIFTYLDRASSTAEPGTELTSALQLMLADRLELHIAPFSRESSTQKASA